MNGHLRLHVTHMVIGGIGVLVLLVALGAGWSQALSWALLLACPLGMVVMMWSMGRARGTAHDHHEGCSENAAAAPRQRVSESALQG